MSIHFVEGPKECLSCGAALRPADLVRSRGLWETYRCSACGGMSGMSRAPKRLNAELRREATYWANKCWDTERGIECIDYNNSLVLVQASVQEVAQALARKATQWERDVLGHPVIMGEPSLLIFRLRGQDWTEVLSSNEDFGWRQRLSRRLGVRLIYYGVSDTSCCVGYEFYEQGRMLETYSAVEGESPAFHSEIRPKTPRATRKMWEWTHHFFVEQSAFEPFLDFDYFFGDRRPEPGEQVIVQNPGQSVRIDSHVEICTWPGMERVDYVVLKKPLNRRVRNR